MRTRFLFPPIFRYIGCVLAVPGFILGFLVVYMGYEIPGFGFQLRDHQTLFLPAFENFTNELALTLVIVGLVFIAFSRVPKEDELTGKLRLNALYWAVLANFLWYTAFVALAAFNLLLKWHWITTALEAFAGYNAFLVYNFFTPMLIFIIRFYYLIYRNRDEITFTEVGLMPYRPFNLLGKWASLGIIIVVALNFVLAQNNTVENIYWALPITLMVWLCSREKDEDEYIKALRLDAMHIAVYTNYAVLLCANFFVYGPGFLLIQAANFVTIPLIFQACFQYSLYRLRRQDAHNRLNLNCL